MVGLPSLIHSTDDPAEHRRGGGDLGVDEGDPATESTVSSEPALNPNQPNHSRPAPSATSGTLCGFMLSRGQPTPLAEHQGDGRGPPHRR